MAWVYLGIAGLLEIGWAVGLKYTDAFSRFWPSLLTIGAITASLMFLAFAVKTLPIGTSYAVWSGIGIVGTAIFGVVWLNEPLTPLRIGCIALIVIGILGLKLASET